MRGQSQRTTRAGTITSGAIRWVKRAITGRFKAMTRREMIEYLSGPYPDVKWSKYRWAQLYAIFVKTVKRMGGR